MPRGERSETTPASGPVVLRNDNDAGRMLASMCSFSFAELAHLLAFGPSITARAIGGARMSREELPAYSSARSDKE